MSLDEEFRRKEDAARKQKMRRERARLQYGFIVSGAWQSCLSCDYWNDNRAIGGECRCEKYKLMPPLDVIVVGCESWDSIPF